jgi:hypothetical protein
MLNLKIISIIITVLLIFGVWMPLSAATPLGIAGMNPKASNASPSEEVQNLLTKTAAYCAKLETTALHYFCIEEITEVYNKFPHYRGLVQSKVQSRNSGKLNRYVYDYQIDMKYKTLKEKRILKEKNGKTMRWDNAPLLTRFANAYHAFYGPAYLLSKERQPFFHYRILKRFKSEIGETMVIEALPKQKAPQEYNYGKAWVDASTGAVLRIEVDNKTMKGYKNMASFADKHGASPSLKVIHNYDVAHMGLHYPGKTQYVESYSGGADLQRKFKDARYIRSNTSFQYKNYLFFESEVTLNLEKPEQ